MTFVGSYSQYRFFDGFFLDRFFSYIIVQSCKIESVVKLLLVILSESIELYQKLIFQFPFLMQGILQGIVLVQNFIAYSVSKLFSVPPQC